MQQQRSSHANMGHRRRSAGLWLLLGCSLAAMVAVVDLGRTHAYLRSLVVVVLLAQEVQAVGHPANSKHLPQNGGLTGDPAAMTQPFAGGDEPLKSFIRPSNTSTSATTAARPRWPSNRTAAVASSSSTTTAVAARPVDSHSSTVYYSVARTDRSGSAIQDMVLALAYAYSKGAKYGGACHRSNPLKQRQEERETLIREVGLQEILKFACPSKNRRTDRVVKHDAYWSIRSKLLTPEFLQWLWSTQVKLPSPPPPQATDQGASGGAVVHIRRGDVSPCGKWKYRYSPNSHYLEVLKRHVPPGVPVTIYSESFSPIEPWDGTTEFANYTLRLDTDAAEVWRAILSAQYVVLSKSSFSYTPALLNPHNATIIYTPCSLPPLPGWVAVGNDLVRRSQARVQHFSRTRCGARSDNGKPGYWHWRQRVAGAS